MLIAKIFINKKQIDEIRILNTGKNLNGFFTYQITKPDGEYGQLVHKRSSGYQSLLIMALNEIIYSNKK